MTLPTLISDFLEFLEVEKAASLKTIGNYDHWLSRFSEFAGGIKPSEIDLKLIKNYKLSLANYTDPKSGKGLKKVTQNLFLIALRSFLTYLESLNISSLLPEEVILRNQGKRSLNILDANKLKLILVGPNLLKKEGLRDRAILELLSSNGLTVSELTSLNRDDVEGEQFEITGRSGRKREIIITEETISSIRKYMLSRKDRFKPLFIRFAGKAETADEGEAMRLTPRSIERIVEKYVNLAGIEDKITPKSLRHYFAREKLENGVEVKTVQELLGHAHPQTTSIYIQSPP